MCHVERSWCVFWQARGKQRHTASGVSVSTTEKQNTGRVYAQCLLRELGQSDDFNDWARHVVQDGTDAHGAYNGVGELFRRLLEKVNANETWALPAAMRNADRAIAMSHPKEITFAMRAALNSVLRDESSFQVERGHFQRYSAYTEVEKLLRKRTAEAVADAGDEAKQRRSITLLDSEQLSLFESILRCSFAASQREGGAKEDACRKPVDTLTLGVITAVYFALGQRGMNLDDLCHGFLSITRWNAETWDWVKPIVLQLASGAKGDSANATKHLHQIMHHRDPMRCVPRPCTHAHALTVTLTCSPLRGNAGVQSPCWDSTSHISSSSCKTSCRQWSSGCQRPCTAALCFECKRTSFRKPP
jgi:hypothetical protein